MDFTKLIQGFETQATYTVTRKGTPVITKGRLVSAPSSTFTIDACVQPLTGKDLQMLPEGERNNNTKVLYTDTALQTVDTESPDLVSIDSVDYKVTNVEEWIGFGDTYYRCLIQKID